MPRVTLMCGPAGAGKTTYAAQLVDLGAERLSMDEELYRLGYPGGTAPQPILRTVHRDLQERLRLALAAGRDVVVDLSLSTRAVRQEWRDLAAQHGAARSTTLVVLTAPLPTLWERVQARAEVDGANAVTLDLETLTGYVDGFEWPGADEPHELISTASL